jgi:hypothetical protein
MMKAFREIHPIHTPMSLDDAELMLWALTHGWSVKLVTSETPGCLWRDPARRRFLVLSPAPAAGLPALSDEVRGRIRDARSSAPAAG